MEGAWPPSAKALLAVDAVSALPAVVAVPELVAVAALPLMLIPAVPALMLAAVRLVSPEPLPENDRALTLPEKVLVALASCA